jgi:periplasmic protein TonB
MFTELVVSVARPRDNRKRWALVVSAVVQTLCLLTLILIPLIYTQALPKAMFSTVMVGFRGRDRQPTPEAPRVRNGPDAVRLPNHGVAMAPGRIPPHVNLFEESPLPPEEPAGQGPIGDNSNFDLLNVVPAPADRVSRPAATPSAAQRVAVTSTLEAAKLISRIQPVYPPIAIQARIQGNVVLHAVISKEGGVSELEVLSGHPLLVNAALEAVRQWRYSPTLLSGQPVEVETTITVSFVLGQ